MARIAVLLGLWMPSAEPVLGQPVPGAAGPRPEASRPEDDAEPTPAGASSRQSSPQGGAGRPPGAEVSEPSRGVEWTVGVGVARSVELFHSRGGIRYGVQTAAWARPLTAEHGPGVLRGRLAWVVEVMPVLAEVTPQRAWGVGLAPLGFRWTTRGYPRWSMFSEVVGGLLGSSRAIPEGTARFNFTAHWGAGVRVPVASNQAAVLAYRFQHISNGDRLPVNPGVNSHVVFVGWSRTGRR